MKKSSYINQNFCLKNGLRLNVTVSEFARENKEYYQKKESYDWVKVADRFRGLEALLHRLREGTAVKLVNDFGIKGDILDAGCGTGLVLRHLPSGSVGLDINPRNINLSKIHAPKHKLVIGDIEKMPFPAKTFRAVVCTDVLEHLLEPQKALVEIFRVLKPDGLLIGSVPAQNPVWHLRFLSSTHPGEPYHKTYSRLEIKTLLESFGKILYLKRGCLMMNFFFAVKNV